jgi:phosphate transport system substrate-binding protein
LTGCFSSGKQSVSTDGSTSMEKVIGTLGEAFELSQDQIRFTYNPTGSSSGIQAVLDGRCDIGLASRSLKDSELSQGATETILAYDAIAILVNPDNPINDLSLEDLSAIYQGKLTDWSQLGGRAGEIVLIGREAGSGTREGFESATATTNLCPYRQELTSTGDVIATVASNPNAIGYASLASVKDSVKVLSIDGSYPREDTVRDGSYQVCRPFVLVTRSDQPLSEAARLFYEFALSQEGTALISRAGVIPAQAAESQS